MAKISNHFDTALKAAGVDQAHVIRLQDIGKTIWREN